MPLNSVAGGNWVRARKHTAHLVESALCARCHQHHETEAPRLWECEHNSTLNLPPVASAARTLGDAETCPALWIRGLVPAQFFHKFPIFEDTPLCRLQGGSQARSHPHLHYFGSFLGFMRTAIFPRLAHSRNCGHASALSSPAEVHRWKSATWAATPRQPTWSNDALNSHNMAGTLERMSADTMKCDEARVHIWSNSPPVSVKRSHLVDVAAHQVEPAERPPRTRPLQPRPPGGSKRERLLLETTHTLTETDDHFHCESCHVTVSQERLNSWLQRGPCQATLDAPIPIAMGRSALHRSHTLTFLDDRRTWLCTACGHVSRPRALKLAQPCPRVLSKVGRRNMAAVQNGRKLD